VPVYRMSGERVHDAAEVYDGVPSLHDAKSAAIAKLHIDGASTPWGALSDEKRELKAAIATMDLYREQHQRLIHSLESSLARYWPELTEHLELSSATLVALLARIIGGPHDVAGAIAQSRALLHGMSHGLMSEEAIEAVLQSATSSAGVRLLTQERVALMTLASEAVLHRGREGDLTGCDDARPSASTAC
jgi:transposase